MTGYGNYMTSPASGDENGPVSAEAADRQLSVYQRRYRIPAEIMVGADETPTLRMPVSASYSAIVMPVPIASWILDALGHAAAISYPLDREIAVLVFPDVRLSPGLAATLDRIGIRIAPYGSHIRLPVADSECPWEWLRRPTRPANFLRLSEVITVMRSIGIGGTWAGSA
ncbi:hypothetical protein KO481_16565 [Nocardia sp. NEAU-G5]|uniref:Uncharacterized protein n=1 Tax=Nocardia albiluteola TaxID=2842303 RepID=A0ABS6B044_9NOCA|nr:hypothetical protein [Nocardia albiluteola]MBU3063135.1 hypothetical protein [Nocardia albiluteola]